MCEVFGFQLARAIGANVPRTLPVRNPHRVENARFHVAQPYRVELLSEWISTLTPQSPQDAARKFPLNTARALILFMFTRDEWGEFGVSRDHGYVVDLHGLLPPLDTEDLYAASESGRRDQVRAKVQSFGTYGNNDILAAFGEARRLGIWPMFEAELVRVLTMFPSSKPGRFSLTGHPLADLLVDGMGDAVGGRVETIQRILAQR